MDHPEDYVMTFGKHKGKSLFQIADDDPTYLDWAADTFDGVAGDRIRAAGKQPWIERAINNAVYEDRDDRRFRREW